MGWLLIVFNNVNQACKFYFNARGANLRAIEAAAGLGVMAPATFEHKWRKNSEELKKSKDLKKSGKLSFSVLTGDPEFERLTKTDTYNFKGGYKFLQNVVFVFYCINAALFLASVALILVGIGYFKPLQNIVTLCP